MQKKINEKGIMGACEYCLHSIQAMKTRLITADSKERDTVWAVTGLSVTLVSKLILTMSEVLNESLKSENPSARDDLLEIQKRFNEFYDRLMNHE